MPTNGKTLTRHCSKSMIHPDRLFGRLGNRLFQNAYIYSQKLDGIVDDIYLQDNDYFDHHREEIRKFFGTPNEIIDFVAIHVRRKDYVDNPFYVDLTKTNYYEKAMSEFPEGTNFVVISDDISWCVHNFMKDRKNVSFYVPMISEIDDFNHMSSCKAIIMANSSFSWWAAYLSNCGKVVAPSVDNWYTDGMERTKCPDSWIRI